MDSFQDEEFIGFFAPVTPNENLLQFLEEADFGLSDPNDPCSSSVKELIKPLIEKKIINRRILAPLIALYVKHNKLYDPQDFHYVIPDELINRCFDDTLNQLQQNIIGFDRKRFRYTGLHTVVARNIKKELELARELEDIYVKLANTYKKY